ncbi:uncharacterized protein LOC124903762 [Homo sapiens]|uniref:uncharacterized protein LOC124903762 n=1 Tax=Homo sapiens TaxID=9606 RepID=UPI0007DC7684|nr:uncharacterized protein LOC124903762 [Homo sapiens]XP_054170537.1 uncharacterized protein LOC124903762 [Homo sapiens]
MRCSSVHRQSWDRVPGSSPCKSSSSPRLLRPGVRVAGRARTRAWRLPVSQAAALQSFSYSRKREGRGRRPGREWGLSPSDPGVRGAVRPDVLGVGPQSVAEDLQLRPLGPKFPGFAPPPFSDTRVTVLIVQISGTRVPTSLNLGLCFIEFQISGSGPCVHQYPGFIPRAFKYRIQSPSRSDIRGSDPTIRNPEFGSCRPRRGGGLDREVRLGCHPLPSRGGFPGPPLRKGESRGRGGKGKGLLAPLPAWQSRWRTPGGSGGAGAP